MISHYQNHLLKDYLPISLSPFLLGILLHFLTLDPPISDPIVYSPDPLNVDIPDYRFPSTSSEFAKSLKDACFEIYEDYFVFMLVMMIFSLMIQAFFFAIKKPKTCLKMKRLSFKYLFRTIISFSLLFFAYKLIGLGSAPKAFFSPKEILQSSKEISLQQEALKTSRILEETSESASNSVPEKLSLSIGRVISSLNVDTTAIILSKNKKLDFGTVNYYGTLKVIDISDEQSPMIISSLSLQPSSIISNYITTTKNMILSHDEKYLFISNFQALEIVRIDNPYAPSLVATLSDPQFDHVHFLRCPNHYLTSMAFSFDNQFLFVAGLGLQVIDISEISRPILVSSDIGDLELSIIPMTSLVINSDGKSLLFANGTLDVIDISNPRKARVVDSFETKSDINSIFLSKDNSSVFVLGYIGDDLKEMIWEEVDISSDFKSIRASSFCIKNQQMSFMIAMSPGQTLFFISNADSSDDPELVIFDSTKEALVDTGNSLVSAVDSLIFSEDGRRLFTAANDQFMILELFVDYPNNHTFSLTNSSISAFGVEQEVIRMELSPDGKYLFLGTKSERNPTNKSHLEIWNVSNPALPVKIGSIDLERKEIGRMKVLNRLNKVYLWQQEGITIIDITNYTSPSLVGQIAWKVLYGHQSFKVLNNGAAILALYKQDVGTSAIKLFRLTNYTEVQTASDVLMIEREEDNSMAISRDQKWFYVCSKNLTIYNSSNIEHLSEMSSISLIIDDFNPSIISCFLSPDEKSLTMDVYDQNLFKKLLTFNVSDPRKPYLMSSISLPKMEFDTYNGYYPLKLSNNGRTGWILDKENLVRIDLSRPEKPVIDAMVSVIPKSSKISINIFTVSGDGKNAYTSLSGSIIHVLDLQTKYTVSMSQETFLLGEKYSENLLLLGFNKSGYQLVDKSHYKFIRAFVFNFKVLPNKFSLDLSSSTLPSWIIFDKENGILVVESKKSRDIGTYTLCSGFSLELTAEAFLDIIQVGMNLATAEDILTSLLLLGYIDSDLFLSSNFGSFENFLLTSEYTYIKKEIYDIVKEHYIETCTTFSVVSSLSVMMTNQLKIQTISQSGIKVDIKLQDSRVKFLTKNYGSLVPTLSDKNTRIILEGTQKEINTALAHLIVNFKSSHEGIITSCDGSIMITDGLNPVIQKNITNISELFRVNKPPILTPDYPKTIQSQIGATSVYTGQYFTISLDEDLFFDEYTESLTYEFRADNKENPTLPSWLSSSGSTLRGTPPEEFFGRDFFLTVVVKNEFLESSFPFKLHIKISSLFALKLVVRYSPYILTFLGLLISMNKIYNILGKRFYKYPKEFVVKTGDQIGPNTIYPIAFIVDEKKEKKLLFKYLLENISNKKRDGKITKAGVGNFFLDRNRQRINKQRIREMIQDTIAGLTMKEKKKLSLYCLGISSRNLAIEQLIFNELVFEQLNSKQEKETKKIWNILKSKWIDLVEWEENGFVINNEALENSLGVHESFELSESVSSKGSLLLENHGDTINMGLLKDSLLGYAFEKHNMDVTMTSVDILMKLKKQKNFIGRFLKWDVKSVKFLEKNGIDYGIEYKIQKSVMSFHGVPQDDLKGRTMVFQIVDKRHRILREVVVNEESKDFYLQRFSDQLQLRLNLTKTEEECRGSSYEVY